METGYSDMNARVKWVKFTVQAVNKSDFYMCAAGWPQAQVVPFPLRWDTDLRNALHAGPIPRQDAWGNEICKSLSLLFPQGSPLFLYREYISLASLGRGKSSLDPWKN
jgi:hypothetical protein